MLVLRDWAPLVLLVLASWLLCVCVRAIYAAIRKRVDERVPDDLPMGAGAWLREYVAEHCLGLRVYAGAPGTGHVDAYIPRVRVITLSRDVYAKRDPSFWATAAHELGHAIVRGHGATVRFTLDVGRLVVASATNLATVLIFANVLYARRDLDAIAFALLYASLSGYALVLVDEALASVVALRILGRDPRISRAAMVPAATALAAAYMTYVAGFVGQLLLVAQRGFVTERIERHRHFVVGPPVSTGRFVGMIVLAVPIVLLAARAILFAVKSRQDASPAELGARRNATNRAEVWRGLVACVLVALVYDRSGSPYVPLVCAAGIVASHAFVLGRVGRIVETVVWTVLSVVALAVGTAVLIVMALVVPRVFRRAPKSDAPKADDENAPMAEAVDDWDIESYRNPPWYERASELAFPLVHVAFVIAIFVALSP